MQWWDTSERRQVFLKSVRASLRVAGELGCNRAALQSSRARGRAPKCSGERCRQQGGFKTPRGSPRGPGQLKVDPGATRGSSSGPRALQTKARHVVAVWPQGGAALQCTSATCRRMRDESQPATTSMKSSLGSAHMADKGKKASDPGSVGKPFV